MRRIAGLVAALVLASAPLPRRKATTNAPRTPWGDPDLQGNFTNLSEAGTPMERPKEYEGRNMNDISPEQRAQIKKKRPKTIGASSGRRRRPTTGGSRRTASS
jgi:hypothetical protein